MDYSKMKELDLSQETGWKGRWDSVDRVNVCGQSLGKELPLSEDYVKSRAGLNASGIPRERHTPGKGAFSSLESEFNKISL